MLKEVDVGDLDGVMGALEADGGVIVRNYLEDETLQGVREILLSALAGEPWCNNADDIHDEFFGFKTKRLHGLLQYGAALEQCLMHPLPLTLAPGYLGGPIILSTGELMAIGSEEVQQSLHRDADSWHRAGLSDRNLLFSVNIALTDFRRENGATVVVPGSHKWPAKQRAQPEQFAYAEMPAGSALIYSGRTIHSGGENETDETRVGLYFGYIPSWLRPLENGAQSLPESSWSGISPDARKMLGLSEAGFITEL